MRRSLGGVRARIERLAATIGEIGAGCAVCREDGAQIRLWWHDKQRRLDAELAELERSKTCAACGRDYEVNYTVVMDLSECDAPGCRCGCALEATA
jgi:hypothetical protein